MNGPMTATYRLQLGADFTFSAAARIAPYLAELGVSHLYLSPIFEARGGSTHGYDVTDPTRVRRELGGEPGLSALHARCGELGLGLVVDFVPNHMAAHPENPSWRDVLTHGAAAPRARWFDIRWDELDGRVLAPLLGSPLFDVIEAGELQFTFVEGAPPSLDYYDHRLPIDPATLAPWARARGLDALAERLTLIGPRSASNRDRAPKSEAALASISAADRSEIGSAIAEGGARDLDALVAAQAYVLCDWRLAAEEINYRRFFQINDLVGVRLEDPEVRAETHVGLFDLVGRGVIDGVRLDHIDGLLEPAAYLDWLAAALARVSNGAPPPIWVEKIVATDERLPAAWPVAGTTGYEFMSWCNELFCDERGLEALGHAYAWFAGDGDEFERIERRGRALALRTMFAPERRALAAAVVARARDAPSWRDLRRSDIEAALDEVTVRLPRYRTYARPGSIDAEERALLEETIRRARAALPEVDRRAFALVRHLLVDAPLAGDASIVAPWQQLTAPVVAKGSEDTTLYRYNRLVSLNEVGNEPGELTVNAPSRMHARLAARSERPLTWNTGSTHDAKRGEGARARLDVLTEIPDQWRAHLTELDAWWRQRVARDRSAPSRNLFYLIYQSALGVWPVEPGASLEPLHARMRDFAIKAAREAKTRTRWVDPDHDYESSLLEVVDRLFDDPRARDRLESFASTIARAGALSEVGQLVIRLGAPGVPDVYRGTEFWDLTLVDPDNRGPVDFDARLAALERGVDQGGAGAHRAWESWRDGRIKQLVLAAGLDARRRSPYLFSAGSYCPVEVEGRDPARHFAFLRAHEGRAVLFVTPTRAKRALEARERGEGTERPSSVGLGARPVARSADGGDLRGGRLARSWRGSRAAAVVDPRVGSPSVSERGGHGAIATGSLSRPLRS